MDFTPILPLDNEGNIFEDLIAKAENLVVKSSSLSCVHTAQTLNAISKMLFFVNSYYSNKIESEGTHPIDIENAIKKKFSQNSREHKLQILSINYIKTQKMLFSKAGDFDVFDTDTIKSIHKFLYSQDDMESFLKIQDDKKSISMKAGELRKKEVKIGLHVPPFAKELPIMLNKMQNLYKMLNLTSNAKLLICVFAYHHRLTWMHPFLDGNGRISRLLLDLSLRKILGESYGIWNISRGLARDSSKYKTMLNNADMPRFNDFDGRGNLSTKELKNFVNYLLDISLEQINYMNSCIRLDNLSDRIDEYVKIFSTTKGFYKKPLPKETNTLLKELLLKGEIPRGKVGNIINCSRRKATDIVKLLLEVEIFESKSVKDRLRINFNAHMSQFIFPDIVPPSS